MVGPIRLLEDGVARIGAGQFDHRISSRPATNSSGCEPLQRDGRRSCRSRRSARNASAGSSASSRRKWPSWSTASATTASSTGGASRWSWCSATCAVHRLRGARRPETIIDVLREYYDALERVVSAHGATLDELLRRRRDGPAQCAGLLFRIRPCAPSRWRATCRRACRRSWSAGARWTSARLRRGPGDGTATVGRIGSEGRLDYTAIGNVVNLASRLCSSARGHEILVDRVTAEAVGASHSSSSGAGPEGLRPARSGVCRPRTRVIQSDSSRTPVCASKPQRFARPQPAGELQTHAWCARATAIFQALVKAMVRKRHTRRCIVPHRTSPQPAVSYSGPKHGGVGMSGSSGTGVLSIARSNDPSLSAADDQNLSSVLVRRGLERSHITYSFPTSRRLRDPAHLWRSGAVQWVHAGHGAAAGRDPARLLPDQQLHRLELQRDHRDRGHHATLAFREFLLAGDSTPFSPGLRRRPATCSSAGSGGTLSWGIQFRPGLLHEIGHALGLKHAHDVLTYGAMNADRRDIEFSLMNYPNYIGSTEGYQTASTSPQTFMMYDIAALQHMYGASFNRVGQTDTYTWSATTGAGSSTASRRARRTTTTSSRRSGPAGRQRPTTSATSRRTRSTT